MTENLYRRTAKEGSGFIIPMHRPCQTALQDQYPSLKETEKHKFHPPYFKEIKYPFTISFLVSKIPHRV
jgi:hypothetical protein